MSVRIKPCVHVQNAGQQAEEDVSALRPRTSCRGARLPLRQKLGQILAPQWINELDLIAHNQRAQELDDTGMRTHGS